MKLRFRVKLLERKPMVHFPIAQQGKCGEDSGQNANQHASRRQKNQERPKEIEMFFYAQRPSGPE